MDDETVSTIVVANAPPVAGLVFRHFRGAADFQGMADALVAAAAVDGGDHFKTPEDFETAYAHLTNCDLQRDMVIAEIDGKVIGYGRCEWWDEDGGPLIYALILNLSPVARLNGVGLTLLRWLEARTRAIAADHDPSRAKFFQTWCRETALALVDLFSAEGYQPTRTFMEMVRPSLEDIPVFPLPDGLEVRPVRPEQYRAIWDASTDAFRDHWGFAEPTEADYTGWLANETIFQPALWQIAWDITSGEVAGQVRTYISHEENLHFGRRRGYTEFISVRRPYRRQGLARALIALSLYAQREAGMTESALGVDSDNKSGATHIYEDCAFRTVARNTVYRKPMAALG